MSGSLTELPHSRRYLVVASLLPLPLSQAGHALAYLLRWGPQGWHEQSMGVHAYFPQLLKLSGELAGAAALVILAILAVGRVAGARALGARTVERLSILELASLLFPMQLAIFVAQETAELQASGHLTGLSDVPFLWGIAGQLPVACVAALLLAWVSGRLKLALGRLRWLLKPVASRPTTVLVIRRWASPARCLAIAQASNKVAAKRGPPSSSIPTH